MVQENKTKIRPYDDKILDRKDIEAVASSRFFRREGIRILCVWAFVTLLIATIYRFTSAMPDMVAFILFAADAIFFVYWYAKKSSEVRTLLITSMDKHMQELREKESKPQG